jgi:hypothetical protein
MAMAGAAPFVGHTAAAWPVWLQLKHLPNMGQSRDVVCTAPLHARDLQGRQPVTVGVMP